MQQAWIDALIGGALIGVSVSFMLLWNGRVTGISGIIGAVLTPKKGDIAWRLMFLGGLVLGGVLLNLLSPQVFSGQLKTSDTTVIIAGLLVGFGTLLGSGCTSGHGVCGISRLSPRSLIATVSFILAGVIAVYVFRILGVLS